MNTTDVVRLDQQLCFRLYACSRAMIKAYQPMLKTLGLTYPQYLVLMVLWEWQANNEQDRTLKHLGHRLKLDSGTLTPLVKRLEKLKYARRLRGKNDQRCIELHATDEALALEREASQWLSKAANGISTDRTQLNIPDLRHQLHALMTLLET